MSPLMILVKLYRYEETKQLGSKSSENTQLSEGLFYQFFSEHRKPISDLYPEPLPGCIEGQLVTSDFILVEADREPILIVRGQ